ncbi:inner membrane protein YbjJ [Clostridium puniceum]|uniref:Inner membrane protein YbjJ n=1 Tax=Clostridium puniceum TaxID=29367 RepID=A0A1S8TF03_9CLOT|nr:MFS transporter [Clostridium puniceum]OOM76256.1 inner membrane protein YbjJ [Clostridium puniceum]
MFTALLIIVYLSFISLGLPDSVLGSAWPVMHSDLSVSLSSAGVISMIVSAATIISSLFSGKIIKRFDTGKITLVSVGMTAVALMGFSICPSMLWICILAIPLGLGAGSVDAALNNFVALHCKAKHMSWLHCFWGIGATTGPIIMSISIANNYGWRKGYFAIAILQFFLIFILLFTLPLWKKVEGTGPSSETQEEKEEKEEHNNTSVLKLPGVKFSLLTFLCYCGVEASTGLWGSSYLVNYRGVDAAQAAGAISLFYAGITLGRFLSGFLTMKFSNLFLIRSGQILCFIGAVLLLLPLPIYLSIAALILIGFGYAPIYPSMMHETPRRFGKSASQAIMGLQIAFAYIGTTFMPPLLGFTASKTSIVIYPFFLLAYIAVMFISSEKTNMCVKVNENNYVV